MAPGRTYRMSFAFSDIPHQSGRPAVVNGANSGTGYEIAPHLAMKGVRVLLACRDAEHGTLRVLQAVTDPQAEGGDHPGPCGLMGMRGQTSGRAGVTDPTRDRKMTRKLCNRSVALTGTEPDIGPAVPSQTTPPDSAP
mgnify:FL=1